MLKMCGANEFAETTSDNNEVFNVAVAERSV